MGLFSWLFGKPPTADLVDRIWVNEENMLPGFIASVETALRAQRPLCVVVHFPDEQIRVLDLLANEGFSAEAWEVPSYAERCLRELESARDTVLVAVATELPDLSNDSAGTSHAGAVEILMWHHAPLPDPDERVQRFARALGVNTVRCVTSMDHPFLVRFAGNNIVPILQALGMDDREAIESPMVTRSIRRAQLKSKQILRAESRPADSIEEWFEKNSFD